jgi:hypothetical protein
MSELATFLSGATAMACLAIGLYFVRYWRETADRLFAIFALAFWVFAANRVFLLAIDEQNESARTGVYTLRLCAFLLIIWAIVDKNRSARRAR